MAINDKEPEIRPNTAWELMRIDIDEDNMGKKTLIQNNFALTCKKWRAVCARMHL